MGITPTWDTPQLWIFAYHVSIEAIGVNLRQFGCRKMDSFVGHPWICRLYLCIRVGATISWGATDVEIEPRGAESRSILPKYISKNGTACVSDVPIMWNPLHSHIWTTKSKTSILSPTSYFIQMSFSSQVHQATPNSQYRGLQWNFIYPR
jgi:hypothetical protein